MSFMPFQYISYIPLLIYLGKIQGIGLAEAIGMQVFWVLVLLAVGDLMWKWSSRKITIQGG